MENTTELIEGEVDSFNSDDMEFDKDVDLSESEGHVTAHVTPQALKLVGKASVGFYGDMDTRNTPEGLTITRQISSGLKQYLNDRVTGSGPVQHLGEAEYSFSETGVKDLNCEEGREEKSKRKIIFLAVVAAIFSIGFGMMVYQFDTVSKREKGLKLKFEKLKIEFQELHANERYLRNENEKMKLEKTKNLDENVKTLGISPLDLELCKKEKLDLENKAREIDSEKKKMESEMLHLTSELDEREIELNKQSQTINALQELKGKMEDTIEMQQEVIEKKKEELNRIERLK